MKNTSNYYRSIGILFFNLIITNTLADTLTKIKQEARTHTTGDGISAQKRFKSN